MLTRSGPDATTPMRSSASPLPKLKQIRALGCRRFLDCTPNYLGRDPKLLARLSEASKLEIWTNTGLYGAANHKFLPGFVQTEKAAELARRWIAESRAPWKPRFIKIGVNRGPLDLLDQRVIRAAAITSRETGLTIASHTGDGAAAVEQLDIVTDEKVSPSKFVWVHAQNERNQSIHEKLARAGAWVEFDGINPKSADWHLSCLRNVAEKDLLHRTLMSQDSGWYHVGEPGGGEFRGYDFIYTGFLPRLPASQRAQLMWTNPREAFGR